jgi:hypothetical protein
MRRVRGARRGFMPGAIRNTRVGGRGCEELARMGLLDTSGCCKVCYSAEGSYLAPLGPCRVALPDGDDAFVCCAGKKRLLSGTR